MPEHPAVTDAAHSLSYAALLRERRAVGTALAGRIRPGEPVGVFMEKGTAAVCAFFGIVYADTGLFTDKREDPAYVQWNSCLLAFNELTKQ